MNEQRNLTLDEREEELRHLIRQYQSHELIWAVSRAMHGRETPGFPSLELSGEAKGSLLPFVGAAVADWAIRESNPDRGSTPTWSEFRNLVHRVRDYLLLDPVIFDADVNQTFLNADPYLLMLRIGAAQIHFQANPYGRHARSLILFEDMARAVVGKEGVPAFDFDQEFHKQFGVQLTDLVSVALVAWSSAMTNPKGFTGGYFAKAKQMGMSLPSDDVILKALDQLAADPTKMRETHRRMREQDQRFRMYNYNPLLSYPILQPFKSDVRSLTDGYRLVAPLPDLITYKVTTGIYHQMKRALGSSFTVWFGHVLEAYIGQLLQHSVPESSLWTEQQLRRVYPKERGKAPDFLVQEGNTIILIESKATEFYRDRVSRCEESQITENLERARKGLSQLYSFQQAIKDKAPGLEAFHGASRIIPILVTFEPLYLMNDRTPPGGRLFLNKQLHAHDITHADDFPWRMLDMQALEILQPHLAAGFGFTKALDLIGDSDPAAVIDKIDCATGCTFKDSWAYGKFKELSERLLGPLAFGL